jgi:RNA polymerase sigma factor (TIGR02999 family)
LGQRVTDLLIRWRGGDQAALNELMPEVYGELRRLARRYLRSERPGHTLQSTALVHEAYLRLVDHHRIDWQGRAHFLGVAATIIRNILVDHARTRGRLKRGGGVCCLSLDEAIADPAGRDLDLVALDDALLSLSAGDPRQARIVELRFFGALSIEETAEVMGLSPSTVKREWLTARTMLYRDISSRGAAAV